MGKVFSCFLVVTLSGATASAWPSLNLMFNKKQRVTGFTCKKDTLKLNGKSDELTLSVAEDDSSKYNLIRTQKNTIEGKLRVKTTQLAKDLPCIISAMDQRIVKCYDDSLDPLRIRAVTLIAQRLDRNFVIETEVGAEHIEVQVIEVYFSRPNPNHRTAFLENRWNFRGANCQTEKQLTF